MNFWNYIFSPWTSVETIVIEEPVTNTKFKIDIQQKLEKFRWKILDRNQIIAVNPININYLLSSLDELEDYVLELNSASVPPGSWKNFSHSHIEAYDETEPS